MSIQFVCPSCSQPIEVDNEFAEQQVVCPYCESVVAAPLHSDLDAVRRPGARPLGVPPIPGAADAVGYATGGSTLVRNRIGNWALAMAILAWIIIGVLIVYVAVVMFSLMPENYGTLSQDQLRTEWENAAKKLGESPDLASKRTTVAGIQWIGVAVALLGAILAVAGLTRRDARKGTAIAGLVIALPLLMCMFFGVAYLALRGAPAG